MHTHGNKLHARDRQGDPWKGLQVAESKDGIFVADMVRLSIDAPVLVQTWFLCAVRKKFGTKVVCSSCCSGCTRIMTQLTAQAWRILYCFRHSTSCGSFLRIKIACLTLTQRCKKEILDRGGYTSSIRTSNWQLPSREPTSAFVAASDWQQGLKPSCLLLYPFPQVFAYYLNICLSSFCATIEL